MDIREFREMGLLAEVNRTFFHPLGLALEIHVDKITGRETLGGILDCRDDPEGMLYDPSDFPKEKIKKAREFIRRRHAQRLKALGFICQDVGNPQ